MKTLAAWLLLLTLPVAGQIRFEDGAAKAHLQFQLRNGAAGDFHQIELMPGGVAALDFNNDGCMDIYFTNGAASPSLVKTMPGDSNRLFRNDCHGGFTDVTAAAGVAGTGYSNGVAVADYDNDGFPDIYVTGVNRNILYHNRGDGTFEDVTEKAGVTGVDAVYGKMWSVAAGWFDADNDGYLDLVVTNYVAWKASTERACGSPAERLYCHPNNYASRPNQIYRNNRDGTFTDVSAASGIGSLPGKGMGIAFADYDGDGLTDIFIANDSVQNYLFKNLGGFHFKEVGLEMGVALPEDGHAVAGMGVDFRDYNNDGRPDLVVTGMVNDSFQLFRNAGRVPFFDDFSARAGLGASTRHLTGWSTGFFDFDNDGWKDLFFANAHFPELGRLLGTAAPLANSVYRNNGSGRFDDVSGGAGVDFQAPAYYRGAAFADFDGDGRVDVVVTAIGSPARLLLNRTPSAGHWLAFHLRGSKSNRDGLGAKIHVTADGQELYNHATTSVGYASSSEAIVRFGMGEKTVAHKVEIEWPSGRIQRITGVRGDRIVEIREED